MIKKIKKKKSKPKKKITISQKQNKQLIFAVILMMSIILLVIFVPMIKRNFFDKFSYMGTDFQKTQLGTVMFYSTRIPVVENGAVSGLYSMNFRSDPRKLEYIEVDVPEKKIGFEKNKTVYITLNPGMESCEDHTIAFLNLANFLKDFAALEVKSAVQTKSDSEELNLPFITCENSPDNTVLWVNSGEETVIRKTGKNCYELIYNNCESIPVTEKFVITILEHYMTYFTRL